jgi:hypothetical protein
MKDQAAERQNYASILPKSIWNNMTPVKILVQNCTMAPFQGHPYPPEFLKGYQEKQLLPGAR